jgi:hypothetical protein
MYALAAIAVDGDFFSAQGSHNEFGNHEVDALFGSVGVE